MTNESMSTQHSQGVPPTAAEHLNLAERFSSFADYAASTASLPQTAATSLDVARFHAFTGELTLSVDPAVRLYLDGGSVYHAEREGDPPVGRLLLDAGVIDSMQLQRGVVSVGDVEHLGRLFDRDTTVDRDAVMVVVEGATAALLQQIANSVIATVTVSAYRHHPSGIHRWFVAPVEPTAVRRPASGVMQVDRSVVEELPRLGPRSDAHDGADDRDPAWSIVWADPGPSTIGANVPDGRVPSDDAVPDTDVDIDIQAELDRFDADRADWAATSVDHDPDGSEVVSSPLGEFHIVWPDGTRDASIIAADEVGTAEPSEAESFETPIDASAAPADELPPPAPLPVPTAALPMPTVAPEPADLPSPVGFMIEPLQIDRIPEPDAAVPDDVATAVRRALQAIETASSRPTITPGPELRLPPLALPDQAMPAPASAPAPPVEAKPAAQHPAPMAAPFVSAPLGFAPPTMETRAEAVYERAANEPLADPSLLPAETFSDDTESSPVETGTRISAPTDAVTDGDDAAGARRGALRRLIGSLRNDD